MLKKKILSSVKKKIKAKKKLGKELKNGEEN